MTTDNEMYRHGYESGQADRQVDAVPSAPIPAEDGPDYTRGYYDAINARVATDVERLALVAYFESKPDGLAWLARAARRFADSDGRYPMDHAKAIIEHPTMQDTPRNRANGYSPYSTPAELYARICYACS